jgi:hypothetical protein
LPVASAVVTTAVKGVVCALIVDGMVYPVKLASLKIVYNW